MRKVQPQRQVCECGAYPFPHRKGSGGCGDPLKAERFYFGGNEDYRAELEAEMAHSNDGGDWQDYGDASFSPDEWDEEE
jgi:hypothetical protein